MPEELDAGATDRATDLSTHIARQSASFQALVYFLGCHPALFMKASDIVYEDEANALRSTRAVAKFRLLASTKL